MNEETRKKLDAGPAPRGGDATTVGATGNGGNQTSGASFRMIVDVGNWERAVGTNFRSALKRATTTFGT